MKVIALVGDKHTGKSDTINTLYQLMILSDYIQVSDQFMDLGDVKEKYAARNDFRAVLQKGSKKVGIVSLGDYTISMDKSRAISTHLQYFETMKCYAAICACSRGNESEITATYQNPIFIEKQLAPDQSLSRIFNSFDADAIFKSI